MDLYGCGCNWEEIGNQVQGSPVKGYSLKSECASCAAKRVANAVVMEQQKLIQEANALIAEKQREMAIEELKKEGKLDSDGKIIK